jgi:K+/H+ antiporter YhaU regulatory subunit KhtT
MPERIELIISISTILVAVVSSYITTKTKLDLFTKASDKADEAIAESACKEHDRIEALIKDERDERRRQISDILEKHSQFAAAIEKMAAVMEQLEKQINRRFSDMEKHFDEKIKDLKDYVREIK